MKTIVQLIKIIGTALLLLFNGQLLKAQQTTEELMNLLVKKQVLSQSDADSLRADIAVRAQSNEKFKPSGKVWGLVFGDVYYKAHADSANRGGGNLQYSGLGLAKDYAAFDFRRIYLGYDYNISERFSTELLLAHESGTSDVVTGGNRSLYIRAANLRWKNIYPHADLVIGQTNSPTFSLVTDKIWGYRSVERGIVDQRKLGTSNDVGLLLQGSVGRKGNYGYNLMVGNGSGPKIEFDKFKKLYGELYAKFWDQRIFVDLYGDFERSSLVINYHQSKTTYKLTLAYQLPWLTIGVDLVQQTQQNAVIFTEPNAVNHAVIGTKKDTVDAIAFGISGFIRGTVIKDKLAAFVRCDSYNADQNFKSANFYAASYLTGSAVTQVFFTGGIDFTPDKNVHIIPNVWFNQFTSRNDATLKAHDGSLLKQDNDLVYRITINYIFR
jgi:hypothetical protein